MPGTQDMPNKHWSDGQMFAQQANGDALRRYQVPPRLWPGFSARPLRTVGRIPPLRFFPSPPVLVTFSRSFTVLIFPRNQLLDLSILSAACVLFSVLNQCLLFLLLLLPFSFLWFDLSFFPPS